MTSKIAASKFIPTAPNKPMVLMPNEIMDMVIGITEAVQLTGVSVGTIYRACRAGEIEATQGSAQSDSWRIYKPSLIEWAENRKAERQERMTAKTSRNIGRAKRKSPVRRKAQKRDDRPTD